MRAERRGCVTVDCYVRYMHELRVGDILHISSAVIGVDAGRAPAGPPGVQLRHGSPLRDGGAADRAHGAPDARGDAAAARLSGVPPRAARPPGTGRAREARWQPPPGSDGFLDSARDTVKPWEIDVFGQSAFPFYIHRFSAGGIQAFAQFGMTPAYMREQRRGMSTFEFQLEFLGELHAGDPVHVKTALAPPGQLVDPGPPPDVQRADGRARGVPRPVRRAPGRGRPAADGVSRRPPGAGACDPDPAEGVTHD